MNKSNTKHVEFFGFKYTRVGEIAMASFLGFVLFTKVGNQYRFGIYKADGRGR